MDAVAAAISHEVGQPLATVSLLASAGLNSLDAEPADTEGAKKSLHATLEASKRTFEVLRSVRATFGQEKDYLSALNLNDVVSETTLLLGRDLAAHKISVSLALEDALPPVHANSVQIQRVINNIVANAIEELSAMRRGPRQIEIRSGQVDTRTVMVEVSDSGDGIQPDHIEKIFEPFFTTKPRGTGLGLSLSRTIVDEHGGRLWASAREGGGTTFHLHMPCDEAA